VALVFPTVRKNSPVFNGFRVISPAAGPNEVGIFETAVEFESRLMRNRLSPPAATSDEPVANDNELT
jgi:hypothetical protein